MKNRYEIRGDEAIIFINYKGDALEARISLNKLERAMEFPNMWSAMYDPTINGCYVSGKIRVDKKRKTVYLHRWITTIPAQSQVDHFDNDTLNNTDSNLRAATNAENVQNKNGAYKNSKSGIRGVYCIKENEIWKARLQVGKKQMHLGCYRSIEEAELAVKLARAELMPFSKEATL